MKGKSMKSVFLMFQTNKRAVNCGLGCGGQGWGPDPCGRPRDPRPSRTHPEPALALAGAVVHLDLAQGNGVDDPVDQLLANLLRGALQRQCPAAGQAGVSACLAVRRWWRWGVGGGTPTCHLLFPDEAKEGGHRDLPSRMEQDKRGGWGLPSGLLALPPAPASSLRQPWRLWTRCTHQGSNRSLLRPWVPPRTKTRTVPGHFTAEEGDGRDRPSMGTPPWATKWQTGEPRP